MISPEQNKRAMANLVAKANAKTGKSDLDLTSAVDRLVEGYGHGGEEATLIEKTITANGTYSASADNADGYSSVKVAVPMGGNGKPIVVETDEQLNEILENVTDDDIGKIYVLRGDVSVDGVYFMLTKENE